MSDDINHPSHYELAPGIEAWDVIEATLTAEELRGFCLGNILKYRLRAGQKDSPEKDLAKANWYRERLRELARDQARPEPAVPRRSSEATHDRMIFEADRQARATVVIGPNGNEVSR